jgi:AMIN domain
VLRDFRKTGIRLTLLASILSFGLVVLASDAGLKSGDSAPSTGDPAVVSRVKLLLASDSPVMEIISTHPRRPVITKSEDPPALTIDLNNAQVSVHHKEVAVESPLIEGVHIDQLEQSPPVVRIVLGEHTPLSYTWDAAGNKLTIRLHRESESARARPTSPAVLTPTAEPVALPAIPSRKVIYADRLASGTSFSAKFATESLRLARGGEVRVCPGTTVSVFHPKDGPELMLTLGVGALETHYSLEDSVDSIVTPDFRILLRGPGEFHYAIRADSKGNTCIRSLPGNTAPAVVYEAIGDGKFEVVPTERLLLHSGRLNAADTAFHSGQLTQVETVVPDDCGCPPPVPVLRAELPTLPTLAENSAPSNISLDPQPADNESGTQTASMQTLSSGREIAAVPQLPPNQKPVELDASLIFSRENVLRPRWVDLPVSTREIPALGMSLAPPAPQQPAQQPKKTKPKGLFRKVGGFFSRVFG